MNWDRVRKSVGKLECYKKCFYFTEPIVDSREKFVPQIEEVEVNRSNACLLSSRVEQFSCFIRKFLAA